MTPKIEILGEKTANLPRLEVILEPGDVLFNAPWWWHTVENLDDLTVGLRCTAAKFSSGFFTTIFCLPCFHTSHCFISGKACLTLSAS